MSSGGARHPAGGPRHLNPVPFPALCLASPRVLCGRLTLQWTQSSRLAPPKVDAAVDERRGPETAGRACSPQPLPASRMLGGRGQGLREHSLRAGVGGPTEGRPVLCRDSGAPGPHQQERPSPRPSATPNVYCSDCPQTGYFYGNILPQ